MTRVRFLVKNNSSEGNRDIVTFLKTNLTKLNCNNVICEFRFITEKEVVELITKGIDKLPAAFIDDILYMDSINIKNQLNTYLMPAGVKTGGGKPSKINHMVHNPEDMMEEFKKREMNMEAAEKDTDEKETPNFMEDYQKELHRRAAEAEKDKAGMKPGAKSAKGPKPGGSGTVFTGGNGQTGDITTPVIRRPNNVSLGTDIPKAGFKDKDDDMLTAMFEETV